MSKTTLMKHRYRPVSEFDEATLASKREYWRIKKREQRAKLSKAKKKVKASTTTVCKTVCTDGHRSQKSHGEFSSTLLNNDGSYQMQNQKGMVNCKKEVTAEELKGGVTMDKHNGTSFSKDIPAVPAACVKVHPSSLTPRQTLCRLSDFNGNLLSSSQINVVSQPAPKCSKQVSQMKSTEFGKCIFNADQHILSKSVTNASASVPICSRVVCTPAEAAMTEEERIAKRRENWRIKKREQRAKRAEKLRMNRDKMQCFKRGQQETRKFSCAAPAHSLPSVNTMALRGARQQNSVDLRQRTGKPLHYGIASEKAKLSPQSPYPPQSVTFKLAERQRLLAKNHSTVSLYSTNQLQDFKQNRIAMSSGVSMQPLRSIQAIGQSRFQQQKFVRIQRMRGLLQGNETPEERLAKQREYWRIKKREQRAKRSLALKSRLKDRDAFNWRAKRYQIIMEQMRKTPVGLQKMPQPNKSTLLNTSTAVDDFLKEDETINVTISQTTAEKGSPALSGSLSVVKSLSGSPVSQKFNRTRARPALHSIPNSTMLSANQRRTRRSTIQNIATCDPLVESKLDSDAEDTKIPISLSESTQTEDTYKAAFKEELKSCDSCSADTPGFELTACGITEQNLTYPTVTMVSSLTHQNQTMNIKDVKSAPSSPENSNEVEPCSNNDSQSTTLLVVASMKKLLEESLSSVGDGNGISVDNAEFLPCKIEDKSFPQTENHTGRNPELTPSQELSTLVKQSPPLCHSSLQTHDFSTDGSVLSCQDTSTDPPAAPEIVRCEVPVGAFVTPLHTRNSMQSGKTSGTQCNFPPKACRVQQLNENSDLQKKREYWRVMKRQQRARKAKEIERGKDALRPCQRNFGSSQAIRLPVAQKMNHAKRNNPVLPNIPLRPVRPVLSPTASSNQQQSTGTRQQLFEEQKGKINYSDLSPINKWQLQVQGDVPSSATIPDTVTFLTTNHVTLSVPQMQTRRSSMNKLKSDQCQLKMIPNQELDPDEALQRKRMHWRIKKQEQRARKAAREKELSHQTTFNQSTRSWSNITHEVQSVPPETPAYLPDDLQTQMSVKDETEVCYIPDEGLDEPMTEDKWRSIYLMDYDPVNQLLVCMVCGEQQYTFSAEEVRAHIEETHPGTLSLEEAERQRLLEAWDEQVAVRERFFTNQLWQNSSSVLEEQSSGQTAEIEVILGQDDKASQSI